MGVTARLLRNKPCIKKFKCSKFSIHTNNHLGNKNLFFFIGVLQVLQIISIDKAASFGLCLLDVGVGNRFQIGTGLVNRFEDGTGLGNRFENGTGLVNRFEDGTGLVNRFEDGNGLKVKK
ncbi:hypothetical protein BpHYR1_018033 [Brachionus plicatilis]|uniref:Uncharacterized protein n=1 Tax=Brachionus plicatilis TaxID=10195 RepID=A0A3M7SXU1_BRAPC|nr:hypothetical protein BpHYR1_018033 [Brachionus plicatilis]